MKTNTSTVQNNGQLSKNRRSFSAKSWLALSLWLVSTYTNTLCAQAADSIAIRNIYLNDNKQLVIEFDNPTHINPSAPQVLDYPGEKHDIVLEFTNTSFAVGKVPRAKIVLDQLTKTFPNVSSIAYAASNDATRARIRVSVSKDITTHPTLLKIDQETAVVNLDLPPQVSSTLPANTAKAPATADTSAAITQTKTETPATTAITTAVSPTKTDTPVVAAAPANTEVSQQSPPAAVNSAEKQAATADASATQNGLTTKAIHGIKGVWQSSLKAGSGQVNKLGKLANLFGAKKQATPTEEATPANNVTAEAPSAISATTEDNVADTKPATASATPVANLADTKPATVSAAPVANLADTKPATASAAPVDNLADTKPATASAAPADSIVAAAPAAISATPSENVTVATPSIVSAVPADNITASVSTPAATVDSFMDTDRKNLDLPRIVVQPKATTEENKQATNDLITPLKTDDVKPEQSRETIATNLPVGQPLSTKTIDGDPSVIADLKTDFSTPKVKEQKDSKESAQPVASTTAGDTDNKPSEKENQKTVTKVALKSMTAQSSGKDYFPPNKTAGITESTEPTYKEETLKHYNEAVRFHLAGKLPEAITEYRAALAGNPRMEEAHSNLGLIFNQQNKYDQAMVEFHKALAINPKDAITYNGIGAAMRAQKNMLAAVKNWQTAISLDPNLASAHYNLGTAYELDKDLERALTEYKLAVKYDDKLGEAYYHMGLILQKMNNRALALEQFKQAVKVSAQADYSQDAKHRVNLLSQKKGDLIQ